MFLCSFHFIVARFCWFLMVFRAVMAATERGKRNVGFLLLLAFSDGSQRAEVCFERLCREGNEAMSLQKAYMWRAVGRAILFCFR